MSTTLQNEEEDKESQQKSPTTCRVSIHTETVVGIVGALQMYHRQTRFLTVADFYKIVEKVRTNNPRICDADDTPVNEDMKHCSEQEQALYQVLAAAPSRYQLVARTLGEKSIWSVEQQTENTSSAIREVQGRSFVDMDQTRHEEILSILRKVRAPRRPKHFSDAHTRQKRPRDDYVEAAITPGMTVDERVEAREKAKLQRREKSVSTPSNDAPSDREGLVRVADTIWAYSKTSQGPLALKLEDAVNKICTGRHVNNISKRDAVKCILELEALAPEWITLEADNMASRKKTAKTSMLRLKNVNYGALRDRLRGKKQRKPSLMKQRIETNSRSFRSPVPSTAKAPIVTNSVKGQKPPPYYASSTGAPQRKATTELLRSLD